MGMLHLMNNEIMKCVFCHTRYNCKMVIRLNRSITWTANCYCSMLLQLLHILVTSLQIWYDMVLIFVT